MERAFHSWDQLLRDIEAAEMQAAETAGKQLPPLLEDLHEAVRELDCSYDLILFQIRTYVSRNRVAHSNVHFLVTTQ